MSSIREIRCNDCDVQKDHDEVSECCACGVLTCHDCIEPNESYYCSDH